MSMTRAEALRMDIKNIRMTEPHASIIYAILVEKIGDPAYNYNYRTSMVLEIINEMKKEFPELDSHARLVLKTKHLSDAGLFSEATPADIYQRGKKRQEKERQKKENQEKEKMTEQKSYWILTVEATQKKEGTLIRLDQVLDDIQANIESLPTDHATYRVTGIEEITD